MATRTVPAVKARAVAPVATPDAGAFFDDDRTTTMLQATYEAEALHGLLAGLLRPLQQLGHEEERAPVRRQARRCSGAWRRSTAC
jgi:hypothetical protein